MGPTHLFVKLTCGSLLMSVTERYFWKRICQLFQNFSSGRLNPFYLNVSKIATLIRNSMPGWLTDHFVCDVRALWRSALSARVTENQKLKMIGYPAWHRVPWSLSHCPHFWTMGRNGLRPPKNANGSDLLAHPLMIGLHALCIRAMSVVNDSLPSLTKSLCQLLMTALWSRYSSRSAYVCSHDNCRAKWKNIYGIRTVSTIKLPQSLWNNHNYWLTSISLWF